jgi:hypothetical protein
VPVSFGLLRPTIVLPARFCADLDCCRLRWVLAHEMTHLQRRDSWSGLLCALAQALFFYLPWCWTICRQVRLCQEFVADAAAVPEEQGADYAEFLLTLMGRPVLPLVATGVSGSASELYRRVTMLLEKPVRVDRACSRRGLLCAALALGALAVVVSGVSLAGEGRAVIILRDGQAEKKAEAVGGQRIQVVVPGEKANPEVVRLHVVVRGQQEGQKPRIIIIKGGKVITDEKEVQLELRQLPGALMPPRVEGKRLYFLNELERPAKVTVKGVLRGPGGDQKPSGKPATGEWMQLQPAGKEGAGGNLYYRLFTPQIDANQLGKYVPMYFSLQASPDEKLPDRKELDEAIKKLEKLLGKEEAEKVRVQIQKALERLPKVRAQPHQYKVVVPPGQVGRPPVSGHGRIGIAVHEPDPILADQLDLPKGQGLVITNVIKNSPAEKAGLQKNDILLQLDGRAVPNHAQDFLKIVASMPAKKAMDAIILRKGKKEVISGIQLTAQTADKELRLWVETPKTSAQPGSPPGIARKETLLWQVKPDHAARAPGKRADLWAFGTPPDGARDKAVILTLMRTEDRFTARHQEGSLIITITGKMDGGKARVGTINIQDGNQYSKYERVQDVPAQYRDKVQEIVDIIGRGNIQIRSH